MNLLITGAWAEAEEYRAAMEKAGDSVAFMQWEKDELPCPPDWVEGIIGNGIFLSHPIESFSNLKYIQLTSAGTDRVPMPYVKEHQIVLNTARNVYSIPMAEFALAGVLQLYKGMRGFWKNQTAHRWEKNRGLSELSGKAVGILGCGSVGTECAARFAAFGCRVIGFDPVVRRSREYDSVFTPDALDELIPTLDILLVAAPATEKTEHMISAQRLKRMKRTAVLVNISRGSIVDIEALAVTADTIGGAVLDVFEEEPLDENSPLWDMENVIVTPHNSFVGEGSNRRLSARILENLKKYKDNLQ